MSTNQEQGAVAAKLLRVMQETGSISKDRTNTHQNYKYRGIDDVYGNLQPALIAAGLVIIPSVQSMTTEVIESPKGPTNKTTMIVDYQLVDTDTGAVIKASAAGEGLDKSDKATNKAWTAAFKYFVFQVLCIPTENSVDADAESPERPATISSAQYKQLGAKITEAAGGDAERKKDLNLLVKDAVKSKFGTSGQNIPKDSFNEALELVDEVIKAAI